MGKLSVMAGCGAIALLMSDLQYYSDQAKYPGTYLTSPMLPVFLSLLVGYVVGSIFFSVRPSICFRPCHVPAYVPLTAAVMVRTCTRSMACAVHSAGVQAPVLQGSRKRLLAWQGDW